MKINTKTTAAIAAAAVMIAAVGSCGGNSNAQTTTSGAETTAAAAEQTAAQNTTSAAQGTTTAAATEGATTEADSTDKKITVVESWTFDSGFYPVLSPETSMNYGSAYWTRNFYQTLVTYDDNGDIVGELAENWTVSEDGLTYTFDLRDGVKFSDGSALTSADVKATFEATIENLGMYNGSYGKLSAIIADMQTPDDDTFVMTLSQPYYGVFNDLTMCLPLGIVQSEAFEGGAANAYTFCADKTAGTGAYMLDSVSDNVYSFVLNPYFWGEKPDVEAFDIKVIDDNDAKILALRSGEIDAILGTSRISYDGFADLAASGEFGTAIGEAAQQTRFLSFNLMKAPFDNAAVRQAVAYAVDQQLISDAIFSGIETPAETLFDKSRPYCNVNVTEYETNTEKAAQLLDEAGIADTDGDGIRELDGAPFELTFIYTQSFATLDDAVLAIASELQEIGLGVNIVGGDMMTWFGYMMSGDYDLNLYYTYGGTFDPYTLVTNINPNSSSDPVAMQWASFLDNGEIILALDSETDQAKIQELYNTILSTLAGECITVPVTCTHDLAVFNSAKITAYHGSASDPQYVLIYGIDLK